MEILKNKNEMGKEKEIGGGVLIRLPRLNGVSGDDRELLLELLKESRRVLMNSVAAQRRKIVELTASRNELMAKVGDGGSVDDTIAELRANAEKMAKSLEIAEEGSRKKQLEIDEQLEIIKGLRKQLGEQGGEDHSEALAELQKKHGECLGELSKLRDEAKKSAEEIADLQKQLKEKKSQFVGATAQKNTFSLMVDYAKAKGMTFPRADKMKAFINQNESEDSQSTPAEEKPEDEGTLVGSPSMKEIFENIHDDAVAFAKDADEFVERHKADHEIDLGGKCPYGQEQMKGKVAKVGGQYCVHKCPWFTAIDRDQAFVTCNKKH